MSLAKKAVILSETEASIFGEEIQQALSSLALEGIYLPLASLQDIAWLEKGILSKEQFIQKTLAIARR